MGASPMRAASAGIRVNPREAKRHCKCLCVGLGPDTVCAAWRATQATHVSASMVRPTPTTCQEFHFWPTPLIMVTLGPLSAVGGRPPLHRLS